MKRVNTGKGQTTIDGKRKKSEDGSGSGLKKPKHECATASSVKVIINENIIISCEKEKLHYCLYLWIFFYVYN